MGTVSPSRGACADGSAADKRHLDSTSCLAVVLLGGLCVALIESPGHHMARRLQTHASMSSPDNSSPTTSAPNGQHAEHVHNLAPKRIASSNVQGKTSRGVHAQALSTTDLLILGLVKDSERDLPRRFLELTSIACLPNVSASVVLLESNSRDNSRELLEGFADGRAGRICPASSKKRGQPAFKSIAVVNETNVTQVLQVSSGNNKEDDRIQKIGTLRDQLRDLTRPQFVQFGVDAVLVIDTDLKALPTPESVALALARLREPRPPTTQCANGQQGHKHRSTYYDLFATVLDDGTMPMQHIVHPNVTKSAGDKLKAELTRNITSVGKGALFEVKSCFGGFAIYPAKMYYAKECRYSGGRRGGPYTVTTYGKDRRAHEGFPCEHTQLHTCMDRLRNPREFGPLGVDPNLVSWWQWRKP
eukprot:m.468066 g.468066  ORF g.468066 m.468066 type:complete len:417 (+) comp27153_c0_seq1:224-1474(+)